MPPLPTKPAAILALFLRLIGEFLRAACAVACYAMPGRTEALFHREVHVLLLKSAARLIITSAGRQGSLLSPAALIKQRV